MLRREALIAVEDMADMEQTFLDEFYRKLEESSPIMGRAAGAQFTQLVYHKMRTQSLVLELEVASAAERDAREAAGSALDKYAQKAEAMHRRLHNRSAAQTAEWLRSVRSGPPSGKRQEAKHLIDSR